MKKHLQVVAAIIKRDDKYFVVQRNNKGELALKWEFPGGKVEINETHEQALIREIKEELGIDINVIKFLKTVNHEYNTFKIALHGYLCEIKDYSKLVLNEHVDSKWLKCNELSNLDWALADIPIVEELKR